MQTMQNATLRVAASAPQEVSHRDAKRERTRKRVERAAVFLALEHGYEHVTVDQICEESDISARTFFNYFGSKDAAIVGVGTKVPPADLQDEFVASEGSILSDFLHLVVGNIARSQPDIELIRARRRLFVAEPSLSMQSMARGATAREEFVEILARRIRRESPALPEDEVVEEADVAVAVVLGVMHVVGTRWIESDGTADLDPLINEALERVKRLIK